MIFIGKSVTKISISLNLISLDWYPNPLKHVKARAMGLLLLAFRVNTLLHHNPEVVRSFIFLILFISDLNTHIDQNRHCPLSDRPIINRESQPWTFCLLLHFEVIGQAKILLASG